MEYVPKGNLFQIIRRKGRLSEAEAFHFFSQICNALHFLHKHELMHRDIKPENILIGANGKAKLCDFGCSAQSDREHKTFCGTVEYMAPEIKKHSAYDEKVDIWSLGVLLYEMTHGYSPFQVKREHKVMGRILHDKLYFDIHIKDDLREILKKMLGADPIQRPSISEIVCSSWMKRLQKEFAGTEQKISDKTEKSIHMIPVKSSKCISLTSKIVPKKYDTSVGEYPLIPYPRIRAPTIINLTKLKKQMSKDTQKKRLRNLFFSFDNSSPSGINQF
eukprot:TRINITY_DN19812_c0_g1_i3.p1 TRINITY_DN19812_c0_g1~~TRINITY_DN19812_c0_g1_i3.p1  ORF type:complete len:275 (+),score=40.84 TRINITY_DN19812_c0_g1_i3:493-1317(+)